MLRAAADGGADAAAADDDDDADAADADVDADADANSQSLYKNQSHHIDRDVRGASGQLRLSVMAPVI
eukprot:5315131-Pleurochrysis_carterae.AAC.1